MRRPRLTPKVLDGLAQMAGFVGCEMPDILYNAEIGGDAETVPYETAIRYIEQLRAWHRQKSRSKRR